MVILADTSVWIDHFKRPDQTLQHLIQSGKLCGHPFVTGELAAGSLHVRHRMIYLLRSIPQLDQVQEEHFYELVETAQLNGLGLSFVDIHLLAAAKMGKVLLWTRDKRLHARAGIMGLAFEE